MLNIMIPLLSLTAKPRPPTQTTSEGLVNSLSPTTSRHHHLHHAGSGHHREYP